MANELTDFLEAAASDCVNSTRYVEVDGKLVRAPSLAQIERWVLDVDDCEATDGCIVEPDGQCPHGKFSWLRVLGII
jgi:hypothetical protein